MQNSKIQMEYRNFASSYHKLNLQTVQVKYFLNEIYINNNLGGVLLLISIFWST